MATESTNKVAGGSLEWQVTVPEGSLASLVPAEPDQKLSVILHALKCKLYNIVDSVWKIGAEDPRKFIHCLKVGLALSLVSLFYYMRPLYDGVGGNAMWAVMTVVVVFEYTVGGSLYKGSNRVIATSTAGALAVGIHWIASRSGEAMEPVILGGSVFVLASAATFSRFIPTIKAWFDYGITIFILTYCLVAISGYRVDELIALAQNRLSTILIGITICLIISMLICPVWAGQELHNLIIRNMEKLGNSLEGCVADYFEEDGKETSYQSQGYKCVLNSKASEEAQANLARWEPMHGRFAFGHPWKQYLKVGAALRHCAYCVEALNSCISSETQAPENMKRHLKDPCSRLSSETSKILMEIANSIRSMKWSSEISFLIEKMNDATHELQIALGSLPNPLSSCTEPEDDNKCQSLGVTEALPLITIASLLMEISARITGIVDAADRLAKLARFELLSENPQPTKPTLSFKLYQVENIAAVERV